MVRSVTSDCIHLQMSEKRAVETTDVTKSFGWDGSEGERAGVGVVLY